MRVRLVQKRSIEKFSARNTRSRSSFRIWLTLLKHADRDIPADILKTFGSADLLGNGTDRVVFDIAGNHYRMICGYHFGVTRVHLYVKWIGSHAEYTELCARLGQYTVQQY